MKDTLQVIDDIQEFKDSVRNNVYKTFLLSFLHTPFFLDQYDEDLLTDEIIDYWVNQFIIEAEGNYVIYDSKWLRLEKEMYKDFVEAVMGRLVDDGLLEMCWDSDLGKVVWKKE